ncbi:hypothetical protein [Streptomyces sp. NPDC001089]
MAIVHEGTLICPRCRESVVEIDPADSPDGPPKNGESPKPCGECAPHVEAARVAELMTLVADWETVADYFGDMISPALLPVIVTVKAATADEAIQAASDKLQAHFGSEVAELYAKGIVRDHWFGLNETDPFLRLCAVFAGEPVIVSDDDGMNTVLR